MHFSASTYTTSVLVVASMLSGIFSLHCSTFSIGVTELGLNLTDRMGVQLTAFTLKLTA